VTRLLIHVEGETEETFVNEVLAPHLYHTGYTKIGARLLGNARQRDRRGGARAWSSVRKDILNHLKEDGECLATTMVDYYGLPLSGSGAWPGRAVAANRTFADKAATVQDALAGDINSELGDDFNQKRFVPYVMMHEFEAFLFSDTKKAAAGMGKPMVGVHLQEIRDQFATPEEINDSPTTAPSKRIIQLIPEYNKPLMGVLGVLEIGLNTIRQECPLFHGWLECLEQWPR
jgi:hypothetical protein